MSAALGLFLTGVAWGFLLGIVWCRVLDRLSRPRDRWNEGFLTCPHGKPWLEQFKCGSGCEACWDPDYLARGSRKPVQARRGAQATTLAAQSSTPSQRGS